MNWIKSKWDFKWEILGKCEKFDNLTTIRKNEMVSKIEFFDNLKKLWIKIKFYEKIEFSRKCEKFDFWKKF